jgi:hypothetical protein
MAKAPTEIKSLARRYTEKALHVLFGVMSQEDAPPAARVAAAQALLDRGWGKAAQAIEVSGDLTTKVIRAPSIATTPADWTATHVPEQFTEH